MQEHNTASRHAYVCAYLCALFIMQNKIRGVRGNGISINSRVDNGRGASINNRVYNGVRSQKDRAKKKLLFSCFTNLPNLPLRIEV